MKTIHLFAKIHDTPPHLRSVRRSEHPESHDGETKIATLENQPDNYWELIDDVLAKAYERIKITKWGIASAPDKIGTRRTALSPDLQSTWTYEKVDEKTWKRVE